VWDMGRNETGKKTILSGISCWFEKEDFAVMRGRRHQTLLAHTP
jgi:hypothetical protein